MHSELALPLIREKGIVILENPLPWGTDLLGSYPAYSSSRTQLMSEKMFKAGEREHILYIYI